MSVQFRVAVARVAKAINQQDFETLKFVCGGKISQRDLEEIETPLQLMERLIKEGLLSESNPDFLHYVIRSCSNSPTLFALLSNDDYQHGLAAASPNPIVHPTPDFSQEIDYLASTLCNDWLPFVRRCRLSDNIIDLIRREHPYSQSEQIRKALRTLINDGKIQSRADIISSLLQCRLRKYAEDIQALPNNRV